jgi:hypothetical protein
LIELQKKSKPEIDPDFSMSLDSDQRLPLSRLMRIQNTKKDKLTSHTFASHDKAELFKVGTM